MTPSFHGGRRPPGAEPWLESPFRTEGYARASLLFAVFLLLSLLAPPDSAACRFNVRDIGFVDLENEPYHLYCFTRSTTPPGTVQSLTNAAAEFLSANISFELINADTETNHPALVHRPPASKGPEPIAVLLSPDGQSLVLPIPSEAAAARQTLQEIATSGAREILVTQAIQAFGVVLLLEGTEADSNQRARLAISNAIAQIRPQMKLLPKDIAQPPTLLALDLASQARERFLLWSLRLDTQPTPEARAFVIYGKARWIGPLMRGEEISPRNLVGLFSMIGADCECGLDLAWTRGTRLPVVWPESIRPQLAKALGFDPDNPLVKTEVSWILSRRGSGPRNDPDPTPASTHAVATLTQAPPLPAASAAAHRPDGGNARNPSIPRAAIFLIAGFGAAVITVGIVIARRASTRPK